MKNNYVDAGLWSDEDPPLFHIGGDETPPTSWQNSPMCDKMIEDGQLEWDIKTANFLASLKLCQKIL